MARATHSASVPDPEPLLYFSGNPVKSVAIDASLVTADANYDNRRFLLPGTLLKRSTNVGPGGKAQYAKYNGTGRIEGVLKTFVEFVDGTSNSDFAAGMYYQGEIFDARHIVDYSTYGAVAASTLAATGGCRFEVPTN